MSDDLGINLSKFQNLLQISDGEKYRLVEVADVDTFSLEQMLGSVVRKCYISDETLRNSMQEHSIEAVEVIASVLPDPGSTMSGEFGEIITLLYQAAVEYPKKLIDPKKMRLKEDRNRSTLKSDVVQMDLPDWPIPSRNDRIICSEVKTKSTRSGTNPVEEAVKDSEKDSAGRLIKTLAWLREKAIVTGLGGMTIAQLDRFIKAAEHPPARRQFQAVVVLCASLSDTELKKEIQAPDGRQLIIIIMADLKNRYESVYRAAKEESYVKN